MFYLMSNSTSINSDVYVLFKICINRDYRVLMALNASLLVVDLVFRIC